MAFLSKYNVGRHVYAPMVKRGVVDHAVGADWTPSAGDVKISKDGGAAANVTNLPTAIAMGNSAIWDFSLTATELSCAQAVVTIADSATKAVEDSAFIVETYGNASAQHIFDLGTATQKVDVDTIKTQAVTCAGGVTVPAATLASTTNITAGTVTTATNVTTLNGIANNVITAASIAAAALNGKGDWNIGKTGYALSAAGVQAMWDALTSALTTASSIGKLLVDNINATISSRLASASYTAPLDAAGTRSAVGLASANLDTQLTAIDDYIDTEVAAIKAKTDNLPASPAAVGSAMTLTSGERTSIADAMLDESNGVETSITVRQAMRLSLAALAGKLAGAATTSVTIRNVGDTKTRITATVDANGNRTAVTTDGT
jgi:hypothetical protein